VRRRRFVLLDRDGTLIVEKHYLADPQGVELIEGAAAGLRRLRALGLGLAVVTNQSAIGRGYLDHEGLARIHRRLESELAREGVRLDGIFYCPHHPDEDCACRKPRTGLVERAARLLDFDPREAFLVGDMPSDVELGRALGSTTLLVRTGHGARTEASGEAGADHVVADLREAALRIEALLTGSSTR
jgi:D-glycero-D-manno-heptose 1,7-bisphosphate phosphatase